MPGTPGVAVPNLRFGAGAPARRPEAPQAAPWGSLPPQLLRRGSGAALRPWRRWRQGFGAVVGCRQGQCRRGAQLVRARFR